MVNDNNGIPPTCSSTTAVLRCQQQNSQATGRQQQQQQQERERNNSDTPHHHSIRTRTRTYYRKRSSSSIFSPSTSRSSILFSFFFVKRILVFQLIITFFLLFSRQEGISNNNSNNNNNNNNNNNAETKNKSRRNLSYFLVASAADTNSNSNAKSNNANANSNGFNYEIEKRVHERVSELMNIPVTMLGLVEHYTKTNIFAPPFLRPHQREELFRFLWTVWKQFGVDIYYGQEDGLFLGIIKGSGTYQEGRGTNGYHVQIDDIGDVDSIVGDDATTTTLSKEEEEEASTSISEEDLYMKRLYYNQCLNRTSGEPEQCILQAEEEYIECYMNCILTPCNILNSNLQEELTQVGVAVAVVVDENGHEDDGSTTAYDYSGSSHLLPQSGPQFPNRTPVRKVDVEDGGAWTEGEVVLFAKGNYIVQWKDAEHSIDYYASSSANNMRALKKLVQNAITDDDSAPYPSDFDSVISIVSSSTNNKIKDEDGEEIVFWCPTYNRKHVPSTSSVTAPNEAATSDNNSRISMGYIPRYYYCLNDAGQFVENDPQFPCTHADGITVVDGKTDTPDTYAVCHRDNYLFLQNQQQEQSMFLIQQQGYFTYNDNDNDISNNDTTNSTSLFSANVEVDDDQKCDTPFVGGYHSRRYGTFFFTAFPSIPFVLKLRSCWCLVLSLIFLTYGPKQFVDH